jgi:protein-tyrosine-phosphatase
MEADSAGGAGTQVLFVCTGNTCRSPLAEMLARRMADERGLRLSFGSAGVDVIHDVPTDEARRVAEERGLSLAGFRPRPLCAGLVREADLIFVMERRHLEDEALVGCEHATLLDDPDDVFDPYRKGIDAYRRAYEQLEAALGRRLDELEAR